MDETGENSLEINDQVLSQGWIKPDGSFEMYIQIKKEHVDMFDHVLPGTLARFMQKATEEHMSAIGLDDQWLRSQGLLWVIVWTNAWIERLPGAGEDIVLHTWSGEEKFGMFSRRYNFMSTNGEILIKASSLFLLMNAKTRTVAGNEILSGKIPVIVYQGEQKLPKQIMRFSKLMSTKIRSVQSSEIDKNNHMNNAFYLDWAMDVLEKTYLERHSLKFFWVEYNKELLLDQQVQMNYQLEKDCLYLKGESMGEPSFSVKMEFE